MSYAASVLVGLLILGFLFYAYTVYQQDAPVAVENPAQQQPAPSQSVTTPPDEEKTILFYVESLPSDVDAKYLNAIADATRTWEDTISGLGLDEVSEENAEVRVQWIKEFGGHPLGQSIFQKVAQVGLGDSICLGKWRPYTYDTVLHIATHEMGHVIGLDHSDDPSDVMYESLLTKYEIDVDESEVLPDGTVRFYPICTRRGVGDYSIDISSDSEINIYVVPSRNDYEAFNVGETFNHYPECQGSDVISYQKTCSIPAGGGVVMENPKRLIFEGDAFFTIRALEN